MSACLLNMRPTRCIRPLREHSIDTVIPIELTVERGTRLNFHIAHTATSWIPSLVKGDCGRNERRSQDGEDEGPHREGMREQQDWGVCCSD